MNQNASTPTALSTVTRNGVSCLMKQFLGIMLDKHYDLPFVRETGVVNLNSSFTYTREFVIPNTNQNQIFSRT